MRCKETQKLTSAYIDRELDVPSNVAVQTHFSVCAACGRKHEDLLNLRRTIRAGARYFTAPDHLKIMIRKKISEV
jgi:predicted anti-sigma-YlaC factor YlaD